MRRALLVLALVWVPFLSIFGFAAIGDSSHPHIAFHLVAIPLLVGAFVVLRRLRRDGGRTVRVVAAVLLVTVALAVAGHVAELAVALARFAQDGFRNRDTADLWEHGPHVWASNLTVPAMMLSMVGSLVLVAAAGLARRRTSDPAPVAVPR